MEIRYAKKKYVNASGTIGLKEVTKKNGPCKTMRKRSSLHFFFVLWDAPCRKSRKGALSRAVVPLHLLKRHSEGSESQKSESELQGLECEGSECKGSECEESDVEVSKGSFTV